MCSDARILALAAILAAFAADSRAACDLQTAKDGHSPVPVFVVTTSAEGFTPTKQVADSTKDLIKKLQGQKTLCLVDKRENAMVVVEILGRERAQMTATGFGLGRDVTVSAKLTAGTFETVFSESAAGGTVMAGGAWGKAAGKVAKRVAEWIQANRAQLAAGGEGAKPEAAKEEAPKE